MNVQFRASFAKDLRNIKNKDLLNRIKEAIEQFEKAQSLLNIANIKKLRGGGNYYRVRVGEHRIGLVVEATLLRLCAVWTERKSTDISPRRTEPSSEVRVRQRWGNQV